MNIPLYIRAHASTTDNRAAARWPTLWLDSRERRGLPEPQCIFYASSAELGVMSEPDNLRGTAMLRHIYPSARHVFVSMGCLGLHAAILEILRAGVEDALLFLIESPLPYIQARFDASGIGLGGEGMLAAGGAAFLYFARGADADSLEVASTAILAKPGVPLGTAQLLGKLKEYIGQLVARQGAIDTVSFWNRSRWCDYLSRGFDSMVRPLFPPESALLDSLETTEDIHYMTLKPLLEIQRYWPGRKAHPLLLMTLGAGGRIGALEVCAPGTAARVAWREKADPRCLDAALYEDVHSTPQYNLKAHCRDNLYFLNELDSPESASHHPARERA
ncbi:MAG: hypothetical protein LBP86_04000 [Azoarcus sp.]|jgi:hypothetical protein|nr:hypothetical protein [Azoarcus sp.]